MSASATQGGHNQPTNVQD